MRDVDSGRGSACEGAQGVYEISVPSVQFCCGTKTVLKNKSNFKVGENISMANGVLTDHT